MVAGATIFTSPTYHLLSFDVPSRRQLDRLSFIFAVILRFLVVRCYANSSLPLIKSSLSNGISMSVFSLVVVSCWSRSSFIQLRAQPKYLIIMLSSSFLYHRSQFRPNVYRHGYDISIISFASIFGGYVAPSPARNPQVYSCSESFGTRGFRARW